MNRINEEDAQRGKARCEEVREKVRSGFVFPRIPVYTPEEYYNAIKSVIPDNVTVSPPDAPAYDAIFSSSGNFVSSSFIGLSISVVLALL